MAHLEALAQDAGAAHGAAAGGGGGHRLRAAGGAVGAQFAVRHWLELGRVPDRVPERADHFLGAAGDDRAARGLERAGGLGHGQRQVLAVLHGGGRAARAGGLFELPAGGGRDQRAADGAGADHPGAGADRGDGVGEGGVDKRRQKLTIMLNLCFL